MFRTLLAALACAAVIPCAASAQTTFPLYGKDKFVGNANDFSTNYFPRYFNQLIPENAGKWGSAAGTTRTGAMRWTVTGTMCSVRPSYVEVTRLKLK